MKVKIFLFHRDSMPGDYDNEKILSTVVKHIPEVGWEEVNDAERMSLMNGIAQFNQKSNTANPCYWLGLIQEWEGGVAPLIESGKKWAAEQEARLDKERKLREAKRLEKTKQKELRTKAQKLKQLEALKKELGEK